jgi:FG-GAP-like repeat
MTRTLCRSLLALVLAVGAAACSSPGPAPAKESKPEIPVGYQYNVPEAKKNPRVVEETSTYFVERFEKNELVKVDEKHVRLPIMASPVPLYREDDEYYYVRTEKLSPEEQEALEAENQKRQQEAERLGKRTPESPTPTALLHPEAFETLQPPRAKSGVRFRRAGEGLPDRGQFRQNIAVADINGDGNLDIVTSPPRDVSGLTALVYLGDGRGGFTAQKITTVDAAGKPVKVGVGYGGVVCADFDGDGKLDIATASHAGGVHVLLQRNDFTFQTRDEGLPRDFSSQALAAFDVDGDGRVDLVVSRDSSDTALTHGIDQHQIRVYRNTSSGWTYDEKAFVGGYYSGHVFPFAFSGGLRPDVLAGCNYLGGTILTWKNNGKGNFTPAPFDALEAFAYHTAVAPGTFGPARGLAIADYYAKFGGGKPPFSAKGINVYVRQAAGWLKVPIWRLKDSKGRLTVGLAMGDLDGDGLDDVVFPDPLARRLRIFYQTKDGKFEEAPETDEPVLDSVVADVRIADFNGDGRNDIVLSKTTYSESPKDPGGLELLLNEGK